ncbi:ureidoglycolate hydrolase [Nemania sp. FL0916]|nr:ureidoglycolate hydrolase [Nemania sp. FL0916]
MLVRTIPVTSPVTVSAAPLTRDAFAAFGDVVANPRPTATPSNTTPETIARGALPCGAVSTNQGTAIQYRDIASASLLDLYPAARSRKHATPRMTMFVCGARTLVPARSQQGMAGAGIRTGIGRGAGVGVEVRAAEAEAVGVEIAVLERHPFTSQTFIPLTADATKRYLVVVAPTLAATTHDADLPVPAGPGRLPGAGLPDLRRLTAFVASGAQAVTYAAGTWHAPMIALGPADSTVDFVVVQFANDVPVEDCQEVALGGENAAAKTEAARIWVSVPDGEGMRALAKL